MLLGARAMLPLLPSMTFFAVAVGTLAAQKGLTLTEFLVMQGFVFAGLAQLVTLGGWTNAWTLPALIGVVAVTVTINSRMILMGAALRPWLQDEPFWRKALNLYLFTDANWIVGMRYHEGGGDDTGHLLGAGLFLWIVWMAVGIAGYWAGSLVENPKVYALDLFMPVFFVAMVAPMWRGNRQTFAWLTAGVVAALLHAVAPGYFYIIGGAIAGMLVGAFYNGR